MGIVATKVLDDGLERLLATTAHAAQREGAGEVIGQLGLDVEFAAHARGSRRDTPTGSKGVKALQRKVAMDEVARIPRPGIELLGRESHGCLMHGLDGKQLTCGRITAIIEDVKLKAGVALPDHVRRLARRVDGRRETRGKTHVDGG